MLRPVFRVVASLHSQELFTATALLLVVGTALLVSQVGLSMALGAFLAGVLLADSEYRHELEADIEPFKGLLLGLFFIAVGMSVNVGLLAERPAARGGAGARAGALKALVLFALGRWAFKSNEPALSMAVVISQGGEFAFVLFGLAVGFRVMDRELADLLVVVVSLSMAVTPVLFLRPCPVRAAPLRRRRRSASSTWLPEEEHPVIIAGFGRVGQVVGRVLRAKRIGFTALDASPEHIDFLKRFGNQDLLRGRLAAGPAAGGARGARRRCSCWPSTTWRRRCGRPRRCASTSPTSPSSRARATGSTPTGC